MIVSPLPTVLHWLLRWDYSNKSALTRSRISSEKDVHYTRSHATALSRGLQCNAEISQNDTDYRKKEFPYGEFSVIAAES